jgi:hypothetical protein
VSLSGSFYQSLTPRTEDVATVEFYLSAQLFDELLMLLDRLCVELSGLIERGLEVFNLRSESAEQVVTLLRISRP